MLQQNPALMYGLSYFLFFVLIQGKSILSSFSVSWPRAVFRVLMPKLYCLSFEQMFSRFLLTPQKSLVSQGTTSLYPACMTPKHSASLVSAGDRVGCRWPNAPIPYCPPGGMLCSSDSRPSTSCWVGWWRETSPWPLWMLKGSMLECMAAEWRFLGGLTTLKSTYISQWKKVMLLWKQSLSKKGH